MNNGVQARKKKSQAEFRALTNQDLSYVTKEVIKSSLPKNMNLSSIDNL